MEEDEAEAGVVGRGNGKELIGNERMKFFHEIRDFAIKG